MHGRLLLALWAALFTFVSSATMSSCARGEEYPTRIVKLVNSFPPGGTADVLARIVADELSKQLGQKVIVENKPGAAGEIAAAAVAHATPDGYTMLFGTSTMPIDATLRKNDAYDLFRDFTPVTRLFFAPFVFVVNATLPVKTAAEFVAYVKASPTKVLVAVPGIGSHVHMISEQFQQAAGIRLTSVPYPGSSQAFTAVASNDVQLAFDHPGGLSFPLQASGKLRAIGVSTKQRYPSLPDVPTIAESGVPGFFGEGWYALLFPAKVDEKIVDKVRGAAVAALDKAEVRARLLTLGMQPILDTPAEFSAEIKKEAEGWKELAAKSNIKLE